MNVDMFCPELLKVFMETSSLFFISQGEVLMTTWKSGLCAYFLNYQKFSSKKGLFCIIQN